MLLTSEFLGVKEPNLTCVRLSARGKLSGGHGVRDTENGARSSVIWRVEVDLAKNR